MPEATRLPSIDADQPFDEACRLVMLRELGRLRAARRGASVRGGGRKRAVHAMRVAARRLRTLIAVVDPLVPAKVAEELSRFDRRLRRFNRLLAPVRDLDVLIADVEAAPGRRGGAEDEPGLAALRSARKRARRRLAGGLDGFGDDLVRFARVVREPRALAPRGDPAPRVRDQLPVVLWSRYAAIRRFEAQLRPQAEVLHALRREVRRLRFVGDFFSTVLEGEAASLLAYLARLQERLGSLNDAHVAEAILAETVGKRLEGNPRLLAYRERRRAEAAAALDDVAQEARALFAPAFRARLERMLRPL